MMLKEESFLHAEVCWVNLLYLWTSVVAHKEFACSAWDSGSIPALGRSPGGENGNPLQYSHLENPMDRRAWQATVHGAAKSRTQLKRLGMAWLCLYICLSVYLSVYLYLSIFYHCLLYPPSCLSLSHLIDFFFNYTKNHVSKNLLGKQTLPNTIQFVRFVFFCVCVGGVFFSQQSQLLVRGPSFKFPKCLPKCRWWPWMQARLCPAEYKSQLPGPCCIVCIWRQLVTWSWAASSSWPVSSPSRQGSRQLVSLVPPLRTRESGSRKSKTVLCSLKRGWSGVG